MELIKIFLSVKRRITAVLAVLILLVAGLLVSENAAAQQQKQGLTISPLTFELTANPGDMLTNKLIVRNPTENSISVKMEVEGFKAVGETGQVVVSADEEKTYSLKHWVKTDPSEFTLGPQEQKFIDFEILIPENAEPGGKYGSLLASITGSAGDNITGATLTQKVGALVLLTVSGEAREDLSIKDFAAPSFFEYGPIPFTIRFENNGTVHLRPRGFITITNWFDKKVVDIEFPRSKNVIPGTTRKIDVKWDTEWLFGKYTATLVGSYGASNIPLDPYVITFWVFPWKITVGIFAVLLILFIFFYKSRRRWLLAFKALTKGSV